MPSFLQLPGDLPWWATLAILVPVALYALLLLAMPFSVFGVKSRMEQIEAQLDQIQEDLRVLAYRLPDPGAAHSTIRPPPLMPAAPPPPEPDLPRFHNDPPGRRPVPQRSARAEPRLDWPR
jgi:hypothetical protein